MGLKFAVAARTDIGLVRQVNEDCYKIDNENNLFIVCDGMGGHQAGEVASKEACTVINYCFSDIAEEVSADDALRVSSEFPPGGELLVRSIRIANRSIYIRSRSRSDLTGMGTTVVAAVLEDDLINIAHVGDSRAYRIEDDRLVQLTTDHSWVSELQKSGQYTEEEASQAINRNIITRALGVRERVETDYRADRLKAGDKYLLCTDGLCGYASDGEILAVVKPCGHDIDKMVDNLIRLANDRGGQDNVTVMILRIDAVGGGSSSSPVKPVTISTESDDTMLRENQILHSIIKLQEDTQKIVLEARLKKRSSTVPVMIFAVAVIILIVLAYFVLK